MIKQKAPKDMTATEFVEHLQKRLHERVGLAEVDRNGDRIDFHYVIAIVKGILSEPAPNPFTPDQLAWMRVEQISSGIKYASRRASAICYFAEEPDREESGMYWSESGIVRTVPARNTFLGDVLEDKEYPDLLCFCDYAPLGEK